MSRLPTQDSDLAKNYWEFVLENSKLEYNLGIFTCYTLLFVKEHQLKKFSFVRNWIASTAAILNYLEAVAKHCFVEIYPENFWKLPRKVLDEESFSKFEGWLFTTAIFHTKMVLPRVLFSPYSKCFQDFRYIIFLKLFFFEKKVFFQWFTFTFMKRHIIETIIFSQFPRKFFMYK